MFLFKKLIAPLFFPLPLCLEFLVFGLVLLWFTKKQRLGKASITMGAFLLAFTGYFETSALLLRPLEEVYPAILEPEDPSIRWIVVLGGGHNSDPDLPVTSQISEPSLARLVEAIRLHRLIPGSKIVLSEGTINDPVTGAEVFTQVAEALGVPRDAIIADANSLDTKDQAREIQTVVGDDRFLLVTSAAHMRRSMMLFEKRGMRPIAAPANHLVRKHHGFHPGMLFPGSDGTRAAESAVREYLGLLWAKLRGQV